MRIGIDVTALSTPFPGGIGTSLYETMRAFAGDTDGHQYFMYAATPPVVPFSGAPLDIDWPLRLGAGVTTRSNILWMQTGINRLLAEDRIDVFWSPRHLLPFRARNLATVATIQDFWHVYFPEQQPFLNRTANRVLTKRIVQTADELVTTSSATASDVSRFYGRPRESVAVIPLGVDAAKFHPVAGEVLERTLGAKGLARPYLLAMDVFNPRKNFRAVLQAVARLPEELRSTLCVVGLGKPRKTAAQFDPGAIAMSLGIGHNLRLIGDVSPDELVALYSGTAAFLYPSSYEGFGMPVLEAMASGCPVITSDVSSLPEVAGDAALLVSPDEPAQIASTLERLLSDPRERDRLIDLGRSRAASFTWEGTARGMLEVFEQAYELKRQGLTRR